jgi:hypothetical protein
LEKEPASQLYRYFSVTKARFGVLTDGAIYRFYSDTDEINKMDSRPFLEINMLDPGAVDVEGLKRFTKAAFDLDQILSTARDMKYTGEIMRLLTAEWNEPSEAFVRHFAGRVYEGVKTKTVIEQFTRATKKALHEFISRQVSDRLKSALATTEEDKAEETPPPPKDDTMEIVTTEEEWRAYYAVTAILSPDVPPGRITLRDGKRSCAVLLDNTNRRPICRFYFNTSEKSLGLLDEQKREDRVSIESVNNIFEHADRIRATVQRYMP